MNQGSRVWSPPKSPLAIEYSAELLRQVRQEGAGENRGVLYGKRADSHVRLLAARAAKHKRDLRLAGLERVGVFAVRGAGEVFLTERDLEFTERHGANLALVLAGERGGFFVREANRVFLTIRSHQEFPARDGSVVRKKTSLRTWVNVTALVTCVAFSIGAASYAEPKAALTLRVHDEGGQLSIHWSPKLTGTLTITDDRRKVEIPVSAYETRVTYAPQGSKIAVHLDTADGLSREELVHRGNAGGPLTDEIVKLQQEHEELVQEANENAVRIGRLEKQIQR